MMDEKLYLRETMKRSYLIQRLQEPWYKTLKDGTKVDNPFSFGGGLRNGGLSSEAMDHLREIFSFDYMGASEFEWGAVPNALQFLAEQSSKDNLTTGVLTLGPKKDTPVYYVCPKPYEDEVKKRITRYGMEHFPAEVREYLGLAENLEKKSDYSQKNQGWLELDNGYIFFTNKEMFIKFCTLMGIPQTQK